MFTLIFSCDSTTDMAEVRVYNFSTFEKALERKNKMVRKLFIENEDITINTNHLDYTSMCLYGDNYTISIMESVIDDDDDGEDDIDEVTLYKISRYYDDGTNIGWNDVDDYLFTSEDDAELYIQEELEENIKDFNIVEVTLFGEEVDCVKIWRM